ncbi:hypothetical protein [Streptomyces sp. NPDC046976]|uniref:hypothetical protein n=1 Tax=Streptomyces sp. NPDC046976 TaxID=3155258 RepID=UPI0033CE65E2
MTPYERLMAEAIPTGRFGAPDVVSPARDASAAASTPAQQAARRALLEQEQHGWRLPDMTSQRKRARSLERSAEQSRGRAHTRHLRLLPDPTDTRAA